MLGAEPLALAHRSLRAALLLVFAILSIIAPQAETWLGKPVIAINTAIYRHALRASGINDKIDGWGPLLSVR